MSDAPAIVNFRTLLAASTTWQTLTGAANAAAAAAFIKHSGREDYPAAPFATLRSTTYRYDAVGRANQAIYSDSGAITCMFTLADPSGAADVDAGYASVWGSVVSIIDDMRALSGTGSYFEFNSLEIQEPVRSARDEDTALWSVEVNVTWGVQA